MINKTDYKEINGTYYKKDTAESVIGILEYARNNNIRLILDYGDVKTGKSWEEKHYITGYIGRSCGEIKIPLLIYNEKSIGGGEILTDCIIGIKTSKGKKELYKLTK